MENLSSFHNIFRTDNSSRNKITKLSKCKDSNKSNIIDGTFNSFSNLQDLLQIHPKKKKKLNLPSSSSMKNITNKDNNIKISLNYLPKRKINFGKKNFSLIRIVKSPEPILFNKEILPKEKKDLEFKNLYLFKLSKYMDNIIKTKDSIIDYFPSDEIKETEIIYRKLRYLNNHFLDYLFDEIFNDENINNLIWRNLIVKFTEIYSLISQLIIIYNKLIKIKETEKIELNKKCIRKDNQININSTELSKLNKIINESNTIKIDKNKKQLEDKLIFNLQLKNQYLIENQNLCSEIEDLITLLDKNKEYCHKYLKKCEEVNNKENLINNLKNIMQKIDFEFTSKIHIQDEKYNSLLDKFNQQNLANDELKKKIDTYKINYIEEQSKNKQLLTMLQEKKELILMLNEELLIWMNLYDREKVQNSYL